MTKQQAQEKIARLVREFQRTKTVTLETCKTLADEHGLSFVWDETYGSHEQEYHGVGSQNPNWTASGCSYQQDEPQTYDEGTWTSSSQYC